MSTATAATLVPWWLSKVRTRSALFHHTDWQQYNAFTRLTYHFADLSGTSLEYHTTLHGHDAGYKKSYPGVPQADVRTTTQADSFY